MSVPVIHFPLSKGLPGCFFLYLINQIYVNLRLFYFGPINHIFAFNPRIFKVDSVDWKMCRLFDKTCTSVIFTYHVQKFLFKQKSSHVPNPAEGSLITSYSFFQIPP